MTDELAHDPQFERLLNFLRDARGFDFTGYKRTSLVRRVEKRMQAFGLETFSEYRDYLEVHPNEFHLLFNTILINVTSFFRDPESWAYLEKEILPQIIKNADADIRIWSAGCASGQEVYSVAILLCQALGETAFRERVKIYATDIDEEALAQARQAAYDERSLENMPAALVEKYFVRNGARFVFRPELRRSIIFGRHDLVQDAPISKLDLLISRNTLMYLNAETQERILARLHFALKPEGYLFLGRAEMLLSHADLFEPVHLQHRIFSKVSKLNLRDRLLIMAQEGQNYYEFGEYVRLRQLSFENSFVAHIVVDSEGILQLANRQARSLFALTVDDNGKSFKDLELSYSPLELRSLIEQSRSDRRMIKVGKVARSTAEGPQLLDVQVAPLFMPDGELFGTSISFADVTNFYTLYEQLRVTHAELETTKGELESTNEELETTNEELQSANEELETTNEELQSANEELETTNAELQSTNEALESTNVALHSLASEVERSNKFLQSVLAGLKYGMIVVDEARSILVWNQHCEEMWGLRAEEVVGKNLFSLEMGLPLGSLQTIMSENKVAKPISLQSTNRRGRKFECRVRLAPLVGKGLTNGLVILLDEAPPLSQEKAQTN